MSADFHSIISMSDATLNYTYHFHVTCLAATNQRTKCVFRFQGVAHQQNTDARARIEIIQKIIPFLARMQ